MDTDLKFSSFGFAPICVHPRNPWLKQLRPTENVEEPSNRAQPIRSKKLITQRLTVGCGRTEFGSSTKLVEQMPCYDQHLQVGRDSVEPPTHEMGRNPSSYNNRKSPSFSDLLSLG